MLRIILMSVIWAICSTCLVRPWFWKRVKNMYFFNDDGKPGFNKIRWKTNLVAEICCFIGVFDLSMFLYAVVGCRTNLYGSFPMIMICFLAQCVWDNQGKVRYTIMLIIVGVTAILWIQDVIVGLNINVPLNHVDSVLLTPMKVDEDTEVKFFISSDEIRSLFKVDSVSGPNYNNGKYIFIVKGDDNGKGIVIIEKDNYTEANLLPISYGFDVINLRSQYPTQKIKYLYITVSDDNVPYGLFAVAEKDWIFGTYSVKGYIMLDLTTGKVQEFKQEELPKFVTNN